jgi:hypothetical protein
MKMHARNQTDAFKSNRFVKSGKKLVKMEIIKMLYWLAKDEFGAKCAFEKIF